MYLCVLFGAFFIFQNAIQRGNNKSYFFYGKKNRKYLYLKTLFCTNTTKNALKTHVTCSLRPFFPDKNAMKKVWKKTKLFPKLVFELKKWSEVHTKIHMGYMQIVPQIVLWILTNLKAIQN